MRRNDQPRRRLLDPTQAEHTRNLFLCRTAQTPRDPANLGLSINLADGDLVGVSFTGGLGNLHQEAAARHAIGVENRCRGVELRSS